MWRNIGKNPEYIMVGENGAVDPKRESDNRRPLDWSSSSVGLFLGLLSLVTLIIGLITYFALIEQEEYTTVAVLVNTLSETAINWYYSII